GLAMAENVNGLLLMVPGPLRGGENNGQGGHDRQVVVVDIRRLRDPPRSEVVLDGDHLGTVLTVVSVRIQEAVPALGHHEVGHLIVVLAVLPAVFLEDHGRSPASWHAPNVTVLTPTGSCVQRTSPHAHIVAACQVVPAPNHETSLGESSRYRLRRGDK